MSFPTASATAPRKAPSAPRPSVAISWNLTAFAAVAVAQILLCLVHAPWRDETQAFLIAQAPLARLFAQLHYEGHPALWYLVLSAASKVSTSPLVLAIVQAAIAVATQAVLWRFAPFSWRIKLLISVGYFILFEYGAMARNYGLGVLLFLAFVAFRRSGWAWVLLALMCNTAVHLALLAGIGALILIFVERRWSWTGAAILGLGGLCAAATIVPAHDVYPGARLGLGLHKSLGGALQAMSADLLPAMPGMFPLRWEWFAPTPIDRLLGALTPLCGWLALRRTPLLGALFLLFCAALVGLAAIVYLMHARHAGLIVILLIGLLWIEKDRSGRDPNIIARVWLATLAAAGVWVAACSFFQPFCLSRALVDWAQRRNIAAAPWAAYPGFLGVDISGLAGRPTYNVQKRCWNTYQRWDYDYDAKLSPDQLGRRLSELGAAVGPAYLLTDAPVRVDGQTEARLETSLKGGMLDQTLYVYLITPTRVSGPGRPACNS